MAHPPRVAPMGDAAFIVTLDAAPGPETTARLAAAVDALRDLPGVLDVAAAFRSLTVHLDPLTADRAALETAAAGALSIDASPRVGAIWTLPVCFDAAFGPDQDEVAAACGHGAGACIDMMTGATLTVLMVGFLPGFPFCGPAPAPLALPRRRTPRMRVPPGSVAVANGFVGIYPWESPGGWHILGNCPIRLFDPSSESPALLAPGDIVRLVAVSAEAHRRAGALDPKSLKA